MGASSQSECNENPITGYQKRKDFSFCSEPYSEALGDAKIVRYTLAKQTPPPKKKEKIKGWGGPLLTIVHATLI